MAKVICEDKQRFHQPLVFILVLLLAAMAIGRLAEIVGQPTTTITDIIAVSLFLIATLGTAWYIHEIRMWVKVGHKKIRIKFQGLPLASRSIPFKKIESIDFVQPSQISMLSGWMVHLPSQYRSYDFGDNRAVHITMKDGNSFLIFSNKLYEEREKLLSMLRF